MHHHVTEDTPPDMLAGAMDLVVRLPDGRDVNMAVERSTPMMDLLVHLTTANKLRPSDHLLQALDMSNDRTLPYKPNTPIGALDTQRVRVIPKGTGKGLAPRVPSGQQPFESTFRLQVHLPRNQFCVIRVGKHVLLEDIMRKVCEEKNLDSKKYEFRHPANIDKVLDPKRTLNDYEITEITVVHKGSSGHLSQALSSTDIMVLQREEERRKLQSKTGGGVLNLIFKRGRNSMGSGSISSDTRSISPTQSDDSRSVTPPGVQNQTMQAPQLKSPSKESIQNLQSRPKPPQRKRRPAPKPPTINNQEKPATEVTSIIKEVPKNLETEKCQEEIPVQKLENGLTICHSRNSSDSSGYHEASILSDNCNTTLPRRPKSMGINSTSSLDNRNISAEQKSDFRKSTGNLANMTVHSKSTMSLTAAGRKKKPPPPPPSLSSANSAASISSSISTPPNSEISDVVANASNKRPVVEPAKLHSDNEKTTLNMIGKVPKPKPRTIKAPVPIPTPRRIFTEPVQEKEISTTNNNESLVKKELVINKDSKELPLKDIIKNNISENSAKQETEIKIDTAKIISDSPPLRKISKLDTFGRTRGFQIGQSMLSIDSSENLRKSTSSSTLNSSSPNNDFRETGDNFHNLEIENIDLFDNKKRTKKPKIPFHKNQNLAEINDLRQNETYHELLAKSPSNRSLELTNNESLLSLRSVTSLPSFLNNESKIRKWENLQSLDVSVGDERNLNGANHWVLGDPNDTDSIDPVSPTDTSSLPQTNDVKIHKISSTSINSNSETKSIQSNRTSVSSVTSLKRISVSSLHNEEIKSISSKSSLSEETSQKILETKLEHHELPILTELPKNLEKTIEIKQNKEELKDSLKTDLLNKEDTSNIKLDVEKLVVLETKPTENLKMEPHEEQNDLDADWQYTLPSPPTAFRDSSPTNFTDITNYDTVTFKGLTNDSIVTSPALFEKLESISQARSEDREDTLSNTSSMKKEEEVLLERESKIPIKKEEIFEDKVEDIKQEEILTSKYLSLETLEKRKSLVLERELASLKNESVSSQEQNFKSQRESLKNEIEEVIHNKSRNATLSRSNSQSREKILLSATDSTLPNFKITTYDQPKNKINIFEDDSIRSSNIEPNSSKKIQTSQSVDICATNKWNPVVSTSSENIYFTKRNSMDDFMFKKPDVPVKYNKKPMQSESNENKIADMISRSESFSSQKNFSGRSNPVKRSKSHISLDKYNKEEKCINTEDNLHKSNSLYNVSGLQSLEVMRMILPKLGNTPPNSPSEDKKVEPLQQRSQPEPPPEIPPKPTPQTSKETPSEVTSKKYQYSGPPAINFATWSDRPKTQVSIKEDTDYKFSNIKAKFNGYVRQKSQEHYSQKPQDHISYQPVNIRVNSNDGKDQVDAGKVNIKINSSEEMVKTISQPNGNVVIKIGSNDGKETTNGKIETNSYSRFLNKTTAVGYRKPLGNINGCDKPRPHSIAFDSSCPDLSRVPIVRAVELKKTFKETQGNNKSVTQILHDTSFNLSRPNLTNGTDHQKNMNGQEKVSSPTVKSNTLENQYRHSSVYLSNENINNTDNNGPNKVLSVFSSKSISRGNSFGSSKPNISINTAPVVKGFRETDSKKMFNFNQPKSSENNVPFSQNTLRKTDNIKQKQITIPEKPSIFQTVTLRKTVNRHSMPATVELSNSPAKVPPPPPPAPEMPKITAIQAKKPIQRQMQVQDPRDQLLDSIRNFGGKAGLKSIKQ